MTSQGSIVRTTNMNDQWFSKSSPRFQSLLGNYHQDGDFIPSPTNDRRSDTSCADTLRYQALPLIESPLLFVWSPRGRWEPYHPSCIKHPATSPHPSTSSSSSSRGAVAPPTLFSCSIFPLASAFCGFSAERNETRRDETAWRPDWTGPDPRRVLLTSEPRTRQDFTKERERGEPSISFFAKPLSVVWPNCTRRSVTMHVFPWWLYSQGFK